MIQHYKKKGHPFFFYCLIDKQLNIVIKVTPTSPNIASGNEDIPTKARNIIINLTVKAKIIFVHSTLLVFLDMFPDLDNI